MSLYGLLLHAHHDTVPAPAPSASACPGDANQPPSTDRAEILRFMNALTIAPAVEAAELEAYLGCQGKRPEILEGACATSSAEGGKGEAGGQGKDAGRSEKEVEQLKKDLAQCDQADLSDNSITTIVALRFRRHRALRLRMTPEGAARARGLKQGQTSGLPTIKYNWECNPCLKVGNMHWMRHGEQHGARGLQMTYIATKCSRRRTPSIAHQLRKASSSGVRQVIMRTTVTGYSPYDRSLNFGFP
jgi:hypothetical protein